MTTRSKSYVDEPITKAQKKKIAIEMMNMGIKSESLPWNNLDKWTASCVIDKLVNGLVASAVQELELIGFKFTEESKNNAYGE